MISSLFITKSKSLFTDTTKHHYIQKGKYVEPSNSAVPSVEYSVPDKRARVKGSTGEKSTCTIMVPVHVKSVVWAMSSKFPSKL